uniref:Uncharacterized protein n=1 Tax=Daphnia galeata TaxID=27404 RepID=A0A8J2RIN4_9CRUS|nr:unnamed protein product [Daphnia galeata]
MHSLAQKKVLVKGCVFLEDNDPKHASKMCRDYLTPKEKREQLWDYLDTEFRKHYIYPKDNLWNTLVKCWSVPSKKILAKYVKTMTARCHRRVGGHTKY